MRHPSVSPLVEPHYLQALAVFAIAAVIALASGCAPTALSSARQKIAAGQYAAARQELLAIPLGNLNDDQRREVKDDLCVSTFMLGEPTYSTTEQRRVCADAAGEPGSQSAEFVAKIDDQVRQASYEKVNAALATATWAMRNRPRRCTSTLRAPTPRW